MFIYMHRRMGTICFLSKSQNVFSLPLAQKLFLQKKKNEHSSYSWRCFFFFWKRKTLLAQKIILVEKKRGTTITVGGVLYYE